MKMCWFSFLCIFSTLAISGYTADLPKTFKTCKINSTDFKDCLKEATIEAVKDLKSGNKEFRLLPLDPMAVSEILIPNGGGNVIIDQEYKNVKMYGLTNSSILEVKQMDYGEFGMELAMNTLTDSLQMIGDYTLSGRILLLPIQGSGRCNITMYNLTTQHHKSGEWLKRDGETYISIKKYDVKFFPEKVIYQFDNLFNGDKTLSDNMNKVLNDNPELVFSEVKEGFEQTFSIAFKDLANKIFEHVPFNKIFIE